jgi:predicted NUDIX family phosphoesterase
MINLSAARIESIAVHYIGNKHLETPLVLSSNLLQLEEEFAQQLLPFFIHGFDKVFDVYSFTSFSLSTETQAGYLANAILKSTEPFLESSKKLAELLYNQSIHPNIKDGELYVVLINDAIYKERSVDIVGIFKTENKQQFIQTKFQEIGSEVHSQRGVLLSKPDKACIVVQPRQEDEDQEVFILDNQNKSHEADFWKIDFLGLEKKVTDFSQTASFLDVTKVFLTKEIDQAFEVNKTDKIELMNRSVDYFKKNEVFDKEEFVQNVFESGELIDSFINFEEEYKQDKGIDYEASFEISPQAVKQKGKIFKSIIKLDKNFHVYVHGNKSMIEQGKEVDGRKFYKLYYENEN